jgi:hypothetical protein
VILRCTTRLLEAIAPHASRPVERPASDEDWYANLLWIDRRKCLLSMHTGTLFPVFVADVRAADLPRLGPLLVREVGCALEEERLPLDALGDLNADALQIAATASRSMVGFLTQAALETRHHIDHAGGLHRIDVEELNRRLRRTLRNRDGYHDAVELVTRRLQQ